MVEVVDRGEQAVIVRHSLPFSSIEIDKFNMDRTPRKHGDIYRGVGTK